GAIAHRLCHLIWIILHTAFGMKNAALQCPNSPNNAIRKNDSETQNAWLHSRTYRRSGLTNAIFDPVFVKRKARVIQARFGERALLRFQDSPHASEPLGWWFLLSQNRTSICCLKLRRAIQKIQFVFSASPETIRGEPRGCDLLRSVGKRQDLAVCALIILST
ncbi:MAG: hypothetical protein QOF94_1058, partial [Acidobacteriaceae bacterium]